MNGNAASQENNDVELKEVVSTSNGQTSVSESSALLENSSDEYIKYQKALERCLIFKKISSLCSRTPDINLSNIFVKEEKINLSTDKSACVSLILRHMEDETFWEKAANKDILIKFEDSTDFKVENLFSILMYDWHEPDKNPHQSYFLIKKFEELTNGKLFEKLWKIFEDQDNLKYHQTCLKILYCYIEEKRKYFYNFTDKDKDAANSFSKFLLQRIDEVLATIKSNVNFKIQILKILIVFLQPSELNDDLKLKILQIFGNDDLNEKINELDITICKGSYAEMINNCDEIFFKLVFIMKKNFAMNFKIEYKKYVEINKNYFGEYWSHQIVQNAKLLLLMADIQGLTDTKEFILINTSESDLISDILTIYRNTAEFLAVLNEPLDNADRKRMKEFEDFIQKYKDFQPDNEEAKFIKEQVQKLFLNTPDTRRLILGRTKLESNSIFEQILENEMYCDCIKYIWNEFELWNKPEILCLKNHTGKYLMDYVLNAKNGMQLISFLMSTETRECEKIRKPIHYMMLKNAIFYDVSGIEYDIINAVNPPQQTKVQVKCLFEYQMFLIDQDVIKDHKNLQNFLYLLEEIFQYCPDKKGKNEFFVAFLKQIFDEKPEQFDGKCEPKMPRKHFYIGLMMIYWKYYFEFQTTGEAFSIKLYGQNIEDVTTLNESTNKIPFFEILSLIIQYKEKEVIEGLADFFKILEELYINTYNIPSYCAIEDDQEEIFHLYEKYSTNFSFIFLYAAIKTNQKNILDAIFDYNHFLISCPSFPQNMKAEEIHNDTVAKFIENRYELAREDFPKHWVSHKMLKNFLDSRITCEDNYYKVDCRFMLPYYNYDKIDKPTSDDMIVNEDYETMKYILHDYNLKSLVSHPVMEMIIRSKISKYSRLFFWNLVLFLTFYVIPTIFLVVELHSTRDVSNSTETIEDVVADPDYYSEENSTKIAEDQPELPDMKLVKLDYTWIIILTLMRVPILLFRELFQLVFRQNCLDYFKRKSNWIEMLLILLPVALFVATCCNYIYPSTEAFIAIAVIEVINIILMITATVSLYPILKFSIYIKCFFKVFVTYLRVFGLLLPLFFGCVAIVFILFDKKIGGGIEDFYSFTNACVKYIIMYSGELSIDADQINGILQVTAMLVIIFLIINKGNLILSIVIDDVQKIMNQAKEISLRLYAEKYVEFAEQIRTFYACNIENNQEYKETNYKNISDKIFSKIKNFLTTKYGFLYWFIKFLTREYSHLHRINILYVEKKSGNVFIVKRRPLFESWNWIVKWCNKWSVFRKLTNFWDKLFSHLTLEEDTMKKIAKLMGTEGEDDED